MVNSDFYAGTSVGNFTVSATATKSNIGNATGLDTGGNFNSVQAGTSIGAVSISAKGAGGANSAVPATTDARLVFTAGTSIGKVTFSASKGTAQGSTASALSFVDLNANGAIGKITVSGNATSDQVSHLDIFAGGAIAGLNISSKDKIHGTLFDSTILAGQLQTPQSNADMAKAGIGAIKISGSLTSDDTSGLFTIAAVGNLGALTVGGMLTNYSIAAGFNTGADGSPYTSDDSFNGNASIPSVKVGGAFANVSLVAGISPDVDQFWGIATDTKGALLTGVTQKNRIGPIVLGSATLPAGSTQALLASLGIDHNSAIEASAITSLKIGKLKTLTNFSTAGVIDGTGNGDDVSDTIVRLIT